MVRLLCIFMPTGRTFTFKDVEVLFDNETMLKFEYTAASDGAKKVAWFSKESVAGYSVTPYTKEK